MNESREFFDREYPYFDEEDERETRKLKIRKRKRMDYEDYSEFRNE